MAPRLDRDLGQHHLTRPESCRPLIDFLRPKGERVVEIGAGGGVLTGELLAQGARVLALELDPAWAFHLGGELDDPAVQLLIADGLEFPWHGLPFPSLVAGNLPYNVGTELVTRVLPHHERIPRAAFLLQLEVARRMTATPGGREYGRLTLFVESWAEARLLGKVSPGAFRPPPAVESAFVGFDLHPPPLPRDEMPRFLELVKEGFAHKRKTLRNSLATARDRRRVDEILDRAGIDRKTRGEELGLDRWLELHRAVKGTGGTRLERS